MIDLKKDTFNDMIQYILVKNEFQPDILTIDGVERPPMIEIPEYRELFPRNVLSENASCIKPQGDMAEMALKTNL